MQDLVYKQGQAGITKATVSIVFNNETKQNSPVGFDHDDKITVTRQVFATLTKAAVTNDLCTAANKTLMFCSLSLEEETSISLMGTMHSLGMPEGCCLNACCCSVAYLLLSPCLFWPGKNLCACSRVQNLFHSVQLNVNNPHFLIMQGRITKVRAAPSSSALCSSWYHTTWN